MKTRNLIAVAVALFSLIASLPASAQSYADRAREARQWRTLDQRVLAPGSRMVERTWNRALDSTIRAEDEIRRQALMERTMQIQHQHQLETLIISHHLIQGTAGGTQVVGTGQTLPAGCKVVPHEDTGLNKIVCP